MDEERERAATVALLSLPGARWSEVVLDALESGSAWQLLHERLGGVDALIPVADLDEAMADARRAIADWESDGTRMLSYFDHDYPSQLRDVHQAPPVIFTQGELREDLRAIAVVGSRRASDAGLRLADAVATALAESEVTVVSGLAAGIDTAAHQAALRAGGRTVAVIGTGIRRVYPAQNRDLQRSIEKEGLVLSQFLPEAPPTKSSFPMRNAVMSGYAAATVVVEAGQQSGARIQARLALSHGRPVIMPDSLLANEWARDYAGRPGVWVVKNDAELLSRVRECMAMMSAGSEATAGPEPVAGWLDPVVT